MAAKKPADRTTDTAAKRAKGPAAKVTKNDLLTYYRDMLMIRRFEEKAGQLYGMGLIAGFCHLYIGQEAVVVGVQAALSRRTASSPAIATTATCWPAAWTRTA